MDNPRLDRGKQRQLSAEGIQRRSWHQPRDVEPSRRAGHTSPTETDFLIQRQVTPPQEDNEEQLFCGRQLVQFFLDTCRRCLPSSGDEANSPASGLDVAPSTSLPGVVISAAGDTLSTIPTEEVENEDISLNPDNQSPMKGMTGVHAGKDIPGPSTTKGKAKQEVTYMGYEVKDTHFAAITPRLPEKRVPTEEQENSSLEARGFTIMWEIEEVAPKVIVRADFPTSNYNCHGWTFLEGEAWLDDDKDVINELLRVGEFEPISISDTKPGDIALYRNVITGKVTFPG